VPPLCFSQPWQRVWPPSDWEKMLSASIVPSLLNALSQLAINPAQQNLDPFKWLMAWADTMPASLMSQILEAQFFPKWHHVLGWKTQFPQDVLDYERVRLQFNYALNMMNSAVEGQPLPPYQPPAPSQVSRDPLLL
jgi:tuftelin-interacting protein 11